LEHFAVPKYYMNDLDHILIPNGLILNRIEKLAQQVVEDIDGEIFIINYSINFFV
jgi:hypoxanthine phosphoribosyltransferase